tara:strand:- start:215 stop:451 length:237 start_codon:yes stop_codon:yes gene_type:complete
MDETQIVDVWTVFKEYLDKKHIHTAAERYVDLLCDIGVKEETLHEVIGSDSELDDAICYYLDMDKDDQDEDTDDEYED